MNNTRLVEIIREELSKVTKQQSSIDEVERGGQLTQQQFDILNLISETEKALDAIKSVVTTGYPKDLTTVTNEESATRILGVVKSHVRALATAMVNVSSQEGIELMNKLMRRTRNMNEDR